MRGEPQVGFSATMRMMSTRISQLTRFLDTGTRYRENRVQYNLNPARCQRTMLSGWMRMNGRFHPAQSRCNITHNNRSQAVSRYCGCCRFKTESCCRSARSSKSRSWRERKKPTTREGTSLSKRSMTQFYKGKDHTGHPVYIPHSKADRILAEHRAKLGKTWSFGEQSPGGRLEKIRLGRQGCCR